MIAIPFCIADFVLSRTAVRHFLQINSVNVVQFCLISKTEAEFNLPNAFGRD